MTFAEMCTVLLYFDKISAHDRLHQLHYILCIIIYYQMIFLIFHKTGGEKTAQIQRKELRLYKLE